MSGHTEPGRDEAAEGRAENELDRPVFVGGSPRSGTTLLRTMLNSHPDLAVPHETRFLVDAYRQRASFGDLAEPDNRRRVAQWIVDRPVSRVGRLKTDDEELIARLTAAPPTIGSVLGTCFLLYAEHTGKPRWGDKRPMYARNLDALFAMFPNARFVNIVRDPRAATASMRKIGWYKGDIVPAVELWARSVRAVEPWRMRLRPNDVLEIRYEDLVTDPQATVEQVRAFCRLDPRGTDEMLAYYEHSDIPGTGVMHPRVGKPITTDAMREWEQTLSQEEVRLIEWVTAARMRRYGYESHTDASGAPPQLRRAFRRRHRKKARELLRLRAEETALRARYQQPVASQLAGARLSPS